MGQSRADAAQLRAVRALCDAAVPGLAGPDHGVQRLGEGEPQAGVRLDGRSGAARLYRFRPCRGRGGDPRAHPWRARPRSAQVGRMQQPTRKSYVGQPVKRVEDVRLLCGQGRFVDDLHIDGMLHAAILRSSVPHGRLVRIDTAKALTLPGVVAVIAAADIGHPVPTIPLRLAPMTELVPYEQPVIASGKVRYVGEPIAVVIAESATIAEDALDLIGVEIEALTP